jgi:ubiquitin-like-conjugating enzyme ATG3
MQSISLVKHRLGDTYRSVVGALTVTNTESRFVENGTLTPEEFVQAGDQLTFKFPTWQWEGGEPSRRVSYLPADKQYLITRNVPCRVNVRALDYALEHKTRTEDEWLLPEGVACGQAAGVEGELRDIDDLTGDGVDGTGASAAEDSGGPIIVAQEDFLDSSSPPGKDGAGLPDFSDLDAQLAEEDPGSRPLAGNSTDTSGGYLVADAPDVDVVRMRTYDLSITYDKYYQTPRMWLFGYDEGGEPLKPDQVYEDILTEYVSKTVTVDTHPLTGTPTVSIHPCKHAQVMKKVVADWIQQGINPRHDLALFVFLKFISGVVPTINYDFTMDIEF